MIMNKFNSIKDVKIAVDNNQKVYWEHEGYVVFKDSIGQYLVKCLANDYIIGLHESHDSNKYYTI